MKKCNFSFVIFQNSIHQSNINIALFIYLFSILVIDLIIEKKKKMTTIFLGPIWH